MIRRIRRRGAPECFFAEEVPQRHALHLKARIRARLGERARLEALLLESQRELDDIERRRLENSCGLIGNAALYERSLANQAYCLQALRDLGPARPLQQL